MKKLVLFLFCSIMSFAQVTTLASLISPGADEAYDSTLVLGTDGNFYGSLADLYAGTVYVVTPQGQLSTLYTFCDPECGYQPMGIIQATDGNLYGTTERGGVDPGHRAGTLYKLTLQGQHTIIHSFSSGHSYPTKMPFSGPVEWKGNFYGTTLCCRWGAVYKVTPAGVLRVLHRFTVADGGGPIGSLVMGKDGYFRGTTSGGGTYGQGTIFEISSKGAFTSLHSFCKDLPTCLDGKDPRSTLVQATNGAFYGNTLYGGAGGWGTIYKIKGKTFKSVYSFCQGGNCADGELPYGPLTQGSDGNLYGVTGTGGALGGGTIYRISMSDVFTTLYSFTANSVDGFSPVGGLVEATPGNFYGTTGAGGTFGYGTVFKFVAK
jgi:uncharacterized repeat protein (TIGR03803 family)